MSGCGLGWPSLAHTQQVDVSLIMVAVMIADHDCCECALEAGGWEVGLACPGMMLSANTQHVSEVKGLNKPSFDWGACAAVTSCLGVLIGCRDYSCGTIFTTLGL